jgi:uncharacterized protein YrrD
MLSKVKSLKNYELQSLDGEIGKVNEFYFDDHYWTIRYLIANTGNWLTGRQVLISPNSLIAVNKVEQYVSINLTKKQIEDSPSLDNDQPVSRQFEESYFGYYEWPMYWDDQYDPHLRSTYDVSAYNIQALDGPLGHVEDFIIDDETWAIRYLIINTRNWWPGKKVLVSPQWIESVSWNETKVFVNLLRETIKQSPEYTEETLLTRDYESGLHRHYNRRGYWVDEPVAQEHLR